MNRYTETHIEQYRQYYAGHQLRVRPHRWQADIEALAVAIGAVSILDYGCGQGALLARFASRSIRSYDPGVPEWAVEPAPADLVVCVHMLEHVEPECVPAVLAHLWGLTRCAAFIVVSCAPSTKCLPDGTPWHTCVQSPDWWASHLNDLVAPDRGEPISVERPDREYAVVLRRRSPSPGGF